MSRTQNPSTAQPYNTIADPLNQFERVNRRASLHSPIRTASLTAGNRLPEALIKGRTSQDRFTSSTFERGCVILRYAVLTVGRVWTARPVRCEGFRAGCARHHARVS
jgi:hypothetical protein